MGIYPFTCLFLIIAMSFDCAMAKECSIRSPDNSMEWDNSLITAEESYTFAAICRCSVGQPIWIHNSEIIDSTNEPYCLNGTEPCTLGYIKEEAEKVGLFIYVEFENYTVTQTALLQCRNSNFNYAHAISVVITNTTVAEDPTTCDSNSTSTAITSSTTSTTTMCPSPSSIGTSSYTSVQVVSSISMNEAVKLTNERDNFRIATAVGWVGFILMILITILLTVALVITCRKNNGTESHDFAPEGIQL